MLTADHPNALWIHDLYTGQHEIMDNQTLNDEDRARLLSEHMVKCRERISPDLIIHSGGIRLSAPLQGATYAAYTKRVGKYSTRSGKLVESFSLKLDQILADDYYGIFHGMSRLTRGEVVLEGIAMGVWRFENGIAVEYWQTVDGRKFDAFFMGNDPDFKGTAIEFWTKED